MSAAAPTPDDDLELDRRLLARGAELAAKIMARIEARIDVTNDAFELEALSKGFERVHRGLRMALAMRQRLKRDHARDLREAAATDGAANDDAKYREPKFIRWTFVSPHEEGLRPELIRLIENEVEKDEIEGFIERMDAWLAMPEPGFMDLPPNKQFHRVAEAIGLDDPTRWPREEHMLPEQEPYADGAHESSG